jgi:hypothetical protein
MPASAAGLAGGGLVRLTLVRTQAQGLFSRTVEL